MLNFDSKIYIAGHKGMVGSSCVRNFKKNGYKNIITVSSSELDLRNQGEVFDYINQEKPELIIDAAAKVGGILANSTYPYDFLIDNLKIQSNLIEASHKFKIEDFIFLGSSCIYPKFSKQPIKENYLLTDSLEETNQWYAIAKISGLKLIESLNIQYGTKYFSLMPTNLYGPNDNFNLKNSHVIPAMIRKFHEAKIKNSSEVILWGTGSPKREFLHVDDLSNAIFFVINNKHKINYSLINVGSGIDITIKQCAHLIKNIVGYEGKIKWDSSKPDGTPRKLLDVSRLSKAGWKNEIKLNEGLERTYEWFLDNLKYIRK